MQFKPVFRPQRFQVNDDYVVRVQAEAPEPDSGFHAFAQLLDLSPEGAKLSITEPVREGDRLQLSLHSSEIGLHFTVAATVRWSQPAADSTWLVGCCFAPQLPDALIERMLDYGLLERRHSIRSSIRGQATAHWNTDQPPTTVGLLDLSKGGFSILSPDPADHGTFLRLLLDSENGADSRGVTASIQWQMRVEGGYVIGCSFLNDQSYAWLKQRLAIEEPLEEMENSFGRLLVVTAIGTLATLCARWVLPLW